MNLFKSLVRPVLVMADSYLKAVTALTAVLLTIGFTTSQPIEPGESNQSDAVKEKLGEVANMLNGKSMIPDIPREASEVADQVTSSVEGFINGTVGSLGDSLPELFG